MAQFSITLPDKRKALVNSGKVRKKTLFGKLLAPWKSTSKTGYLVRTDPRDGASKDYFLYKATDGKWSLDPEGRQAPQANTMEMAIKNAIELYERK